ncbi:hypothetical protein [Microbacterium testaceum]|uniref:hypothetical protein n=1 Tax=Microbacterium testaceum TaxID=2033 RepID=UPI002435E103|nr:hypothetical protein [Microbacterium testaceum]
MSLLRVLAAAAVVGLALLVAPAAIAPGFGGGDLIVIFAPVALLWLCAPRARPELSAGVSSAPTDVPHITEPPADTTP